MRTERFPAQQVYADAAAQIAGHLDEGQDVVVLCEGDRSTEGRVCPRFARPVRQGFGLATQLDIVHMYE